MSSDPVIKVENLSKCYAIFDKPRDRLLQMLARSRKKFYREFWALKDVSFEVKRGETVGIIGRNGSGKSTLLQMICGTLNPSSGNIQVKGRVAALLELGAGFNPEFTGRENVYMNAELLGLGRVEIDERFEAIAEFADIGEFIDQPVKTYSSGMYVRLAFAVIAHVDADILVVDEALAVGDAFFTQKCMRFLREFMKTGTILFVSHDTAAVKNLCNKAIWLEHGRIRQEGSPKEVCDNYLEAYYEAIQGKSENTRINPVPMEPQQPKDSQHVVDQREQYLNSSNLRNDLRVFEFDRDAASFGQGDARITNVQMQNPEGNPLSWIVGGEAVCLYVEALAHAEIYSPIIGFYIKDRLGQALFGENTYLSYMDKPLACAAGHTITARFYFQMPRLAGGEYSITVALATGTQNEHVQQHWIHDALLFKSESTSVSAGLIGIPMAKITLETMP